MGSGKTQPLALPGYLTQQCGPFYHLEASLAEIGHDSRVFRHGRGVDHQGVGRVAECLRHGFLYIVIESDNRTLLLEMPGQLAGCAVVACNCVTF